MTTPVLEVTGLSRFFGGLPAVRDVSMRIPAGERRLLLGPNGAGKTTFFNLVACHFQPSQGDIRIFGQNVTRKSANQRTHLGMARTYQIITLFAKNTLLHNVVISLVGLRQIRFNPWSDLRRQKPLWDEARAILALVGLEDLADRSVARRAMANGGGSRSRWRSPKNQTSCCPTSRWLGFPPTNVRTFSACF